jgi:hypothetical protein
MAFVLRLISTVLFWRSAYFAVRSVFRLFSRRGRSPLSLQARRRRGLFR